jgi:ribosome-binding ATPase YchF (GTP1/OBG family)
VQAEDPFLEQPIEDIETINNDMTASQKKDVDKALDDLEKADEEFAGEEEKDAAVETVLASRKESMKNIDTHGMVLQKKKMIDTTISYVFVAVIVEHFQNPQLIVSQYSPRRRALG